ncbi:MAG: D-Ala-D-Ala carboxypeptidase family metallohydrolase [Cyanobacteria bacterium]|nr:D-Ala-D-Ala carboxypeptidase family metallohydrolase [Cyanobacteriota bacterium]MDW8199875.1 D-Ala-D-Ala carboxypeptidase family metallohydrolase [Cyanobacteriota bacterium SKYGB_h_bin112]
MDKLTPDQRNYIYLLEAERTGIHKPILAALYAVQRQPNLPDGETGLGIEPANRIPLEQVNSFNGQVQFAANTVRSITDNLINLGVSSSELWDQEQGRYGDRLLEAIARGYAPPPGDATSARLEACDPVALKQAYYQDIDTDFSAEHLPHNLAYLDNALMRFVERIPDYMHGLPHQRDALLEALRIWRRLDTRQVTISALTMQLPANVVSESMDESYLDPALLQFIQQVPRNYVGYPHQREALLRLAQLWRQQDSREATIASLANNTSPQPDFSFLDPALIALVERIPQAYQGKGLQRNALVEGFRLWRQLDSRPTALLELGINPGLLASSTPNPADIAEAGAQLDRALLQFVRRLPGEYKETEQQREALLRLAQLWRDLPDQKKTVESLVEDLKRMEQARRDSQDAPPRPSLLITPRRPARWTPTNIQPHASIVPGGSFTWAEATAGGSRIPPDQVTVDAIIRIAQLAQQARDRIGRPFHVTSWYRPPAVNARVGGVFNSRHIVGDAIDFYCDGLTGNQIYWFLDAWWPGGLGRYRKFPYLCHIDARGYRARWLH